MDSVIDLTAARELVSNEVLWLRVRDFLWDFAPQVHESWIDSLDAQLEVDPSLVSRLTSSPRVKQYILNSLGVEPCFHIFPKDDGSRLMLLDGATLELIVKWLGALACAEYLRKVTDGAVVRSLKTALSGVYPDVFGYTAYFKGKDFQHRDAETQSLIDEILACGFEMLLSSVSDLPSSLVSRLKFKLPKSLCDSAMLRLKERPSQTTLPVILKLLKLKFPEAYSLCCS